MRKFLVKVVAPVVAVLIPVAASAAAVDVAAVVTDIGAQLVPVGLVGGAVLLVFLGVKAFKWIRGAMA